MFSGLIDTVVDFDGTTFRNIPSVTPSEDLLDDLSDDPKDRAFGEALVADQKDPDYRSPIIMRPFLYGVSLDGSASARVPTRFSDGRRFGVWYGSLSLITTVYETVYHWRRRLADMLTTIQGEVVSDRRVFKVSVRRVIIDLRDKHRRFPALIDPIDYTFTNALGEHLHRNGQNGLLVQAARHPEGVNLAAFKPDILSDPRHHSYLVYRWTPGESAVRVEKNAGRVWKRIICSPR